MVLVCTENVIDLDITKLKGLLGPCKLEYLYLYWDQSRYTMYNVLNVENI